MHSSYGKNKTERNQADSRSQRAVTKFLLQINRDHEQEKKEDESKEATGHAGTEKGRYLKELAVNDGIGRAALDDYEDQQQGERQNDQPERQRRVAIASLKKVQTDKETR